MAYHLIQDDKRTITMVLPAGTKVDIEFGGTDGRLTVDFAHDEPNRLFVHADMPDTEGREGIIYMEEWDDSPDEEDGDPIETAFYKSPTAKPDPLLTKRLCKTYAAYRTGFGYEMPTWESLTEEQRGGFEAMATVANRALNNMDRTPTEEQPQPAKLPDHECG
jgi:hypothetical protein